MIGQSIKIDVSDNDCSELPLNWQHGAASVDTLGNCVQFYDEPKCQGSLLVLSPFQIIHMMDLSLVNFANRIRTASPCGPKVKDGRYVIQNAADASVMAALNKHGNFAKAWTVNTTKASAVPKSQQWEVVEKSNNEYFLKPRENSDNYPVSFDEESLKKGVIKRKVWKIMSVGRGRYIIKDSATQRCLYKTDDHKVEEHSCRIWSLNQEWVFRTILGDPPAEKPKSAQVGSGINFNILSKVATQRPPTKPLPQYYPIHYNATKLAQIKKYSTAAPYTIKKKIKRGPRPKTKYVDEPSLNLKPPGLRPALPKHVANNNNFLLFKSPDGPAKDSYLPDFIPTDDIDILPTKEMIKNSKQYQDYVKVVKQYLAEQYTKALQNTQNINNFYKNKDKKKTVDESEEDEDKGGEEEDEETKENDDDENSDESASEGTAASKVTERPKKVKETYSSAVGSTGSAQDSGVIVESDRPGFMSKVFTKFKSNFAAVVPTVQFQLPKIPNVLPSLPSLPVPKLTLSFTKGGSSDKDKNESSQKENTSSRYSFNYSKYGKNSNSYEESPKITFPFGRPGSRFFMRASSTTTKKPLTVGSWGIFG
ncbi:unnamed protein product [Orchesella dallaii]|uniref:Uncharacterized protein n=1 Tax=Orchesella dallaii TaxID=48710 RepID=A0ABP1RDI8_9HEXA